MKNPYTATSLEHGDIMCVTVKLMVGHHNDESGKPYYTLYRCPYPNAEIGEDDSPQGDKIFSNQAEIANVLFPVVQWTGLPSMAF